MIDNLEKELSLLFRGSDTHHTVHMLCTILRCLEADNKRIIQALHKAGLDEGIH